MPRDNPKCEPGDECIECGELGTVMLIRTRVDGSEVGVCSGCELEFRRVRDVRNGA